MERDDGLKYDIGEAAGESELNFAGHSWTRCYRAERDSMRIPQRAFFLWQGDTIDRLLEGGAKVYVARDVERPAFLYGWICAERRDAALVVHYAFTKRAFRERGIGNALLQHAVTELGEGAEELWQSHGSDAHDARLREMGFIRVPVEELLHEPRRVA